ncbi:MAG: hypothetical protein HYX83_02935 [Chloroflexi bacterium]|nr:hypothetical protein [Chloroflexota bacterium]
MPDLKSAINIVEILIAALAILVLGNYLGYKMGRWRLAALIGIIALIIIIAFAIYAAVLLGLPE